MEYGILLWGNTANVEIIFVLQNRAIRAIYKLAPAPRVSLRDKFEEINILTFITFFEIHFFIEMNFKNSDEQTLNTYKKQKTCYL